MSSLVSSYLGEGSGSSKLSKLVRDGRGQWVSSDMVEVSLVSSEMVEVSGCLGEYEV